MNFADLTDTDFSFRCEFTGDGCEYWDYELSIRNWDEKYYRDMTRVEIEQLRNNCRKILEATDGFIQGGN